MFLLTTIIIPNQENRKISGGNSIMVTPKGFVDEFMEFLKNYQVIGLAIAVIIGAAAGKMVTAMVNDIIMPIIAVHYPRAETGKRRSFRSAR